MLKQDYLRDGTAIYERSFAIIRAEADFTRFSPEEAEIAVRMIHACGQVETARLIEFGPTREIFTNPKDRRTEDYITGRFG